MAVFILIFFSSCKQRYVDGTYRLGPRGYELMRQLNLGELKDSFLVNLLYGYIEDAVNNSTKYEVVLTSSGNITITKGFSSFLYTNLETESGSYWIEQGKQVLMTTEDPLVNRLIGEFDNEDYNTLYLLFSNFERIPLDKQ